MMSFDALIRHIGPSPVLRNLAQLDLLFKHVLVLDWAPLVDLLTACTNLRRLHGYFDGPDAIGRLPELPLRVARPERLEELAISGDSCTDVVLASLYASTQLVTLNIVASLKKIDYRLFCQAIKASSRTLRSICLCVSFTREQRFDSQDLAGALASCTSLRFLRLGELYPMFGRLSLRDLFELLAPLPIEVLAIHHNLFELFEELHFPNLSVVMLRRDLDHHTFAIHRLKSKFPHLVIETLQDISVWPPPFQSLSPKSRAIFEFRPYRAVFPPSIPSASS
jgi:hypothetical protein